jgi:hypothetical protein
MHIKAQKRMLQGISMAVLTVASVWWGYRTARADQDQGKCCKEWHAHSDCSGCEPIDNDGDGTDDIAIHVGGNTLYKCVNGDSSDVCDEQDETCATLMQATAFHLIGGCSFPVGVYNGTFEAPQCSSDNPPDTPCDPYSP